jgi:hypothetical protein
MKTFHLFILALFTGVSFAIADKPAPVTPLNMLLIITDRNGASTFGFTTVFAGIRSELGKAGATRD